MLRTDISFNLSTTNTKAVLLDIEGTTTPISFVYDVLFPFARDRVTDYLEKQFDRADVRQDLQLLRREHDAESAPERPQLSSHSRAEEIASVTAYLHWLMDQDRKSTALKSLQGKIWEEGYREGRLRSQVFPDVLPAFQRWKAAGLRIAIFSSGSVLAQKLLFANTEQGDLTDFIEYYFDTTTGSKSDPRSFQRIAATMELTAGEVLFISDIVAELDAALESDMNTLLCVRPGNHQQPSNHQHSIIETLEEVG
jgi:enolase-phosphatase E1